MIGDHWEDANYFNVLQHTSTAICFGHELFFGSEDGSRFNCGSKSLELFYHHFLDPLSSSHLAMMMSIRGNNVSGVGDQNTPQDITKTI